MTVDQPVPSTPGDRASRPPGRGRIVVGVDGSTGSLTALRWAIEEARAHSRTLHAVTAWHYPELGYGYGDGWTQAPDQGADSIAAAAEKALEAAVDQTAPPGSDLDHTVTITKATVEGHASQVLLHEAQGADLLVVGSRGHGGFVGLLLGSVGHHLVTHARCPTVVVPTPDQH
jgi:nucleotide-binding universal stress UspA family protein